MNHPHAHGRTSTRGPRDSAHNWGTPPGGDRGLRASDADRERVAQQLRDHCEAGRLSADELGQRLEATFAARTLADLDPVLTDLPRPASARPERRGYGGPPRWGRVPTLLVVLLAISIVSGHPVIWLAIPLLLLTVWRRSPLGSASSRRGHRGDRGGRGGPRVGRGASAA